jgi:hypothetical protein
MQARQIGREKPVQREGREQQGAKASGKYPQPSLAQLGVRRRQQRAPF